ncbi:8410_t:CDS:2 [Ambispora gerdemannii]|uniref:8410_t:CDS:1 n=1 Tax=Ambispora gerdemannii TaxID=144530 RepID=A0A9N9FSV6_9GLOM|nr:8410_t:CDS:2 [Ambispora gerdemannii]
MDQNYPINGTCQEENSLTGNNNFGKRRAEVKTSLDLSNCNKLAELTCDNDQYSIPLVIIPTIKKDIIDKKNKIEQQKANLEFDDTKKELLEKLIISQRDSSKAQKLRLPFYKIEKGKYKIYDELVDKLGELGEDEEFMKKIQLILTDCEELVAQELELEKYNQKQAEIVNITFPKKKNIKVTSVGLSEKEYG